MKNSKTGASDGRDEPVICTKPVNSRQSDEASQLSQKVAPPLEEAKEFQESLSSGSIGAPANDQNYAAFITL